MHVDTVFELPKCNDLNALVDSHVQNANMISERLNGW